MHLGLGSCLSINHPVDSLQLAVHCQNELTLYRTTDPAPITCSLPRPRAFEYAASHQQACRASSGHAICRFLSAATLMPEARLIDPEELLSLPVAGQSDPIRDGMSLDHLVNNLERPQICELLLFSAEIAWIGSEMAAVSCNADKSEFANVQRHGAHC